MRALTILAMSAVTALTSSAAMAQTKSLTGDTKVVTATVEAIDQATRQVTLKNGDGTYEVLDVPASVKRFDGLKVGDKVKARSTTRTSCSGEAARREGRGQLRRGGHALRKRRQASGHARQPAQRHRDDHGYRSERAFDHVPRARTAGSLQHRCRTRPRSRR